MRSLIAPILLTAATAACASQASVQPGPRGLRASHHLEAARVHAEEAQRAAWPDQRRSGDGAIASPSTAAMSPWSYDWDPVVDHERLASIHRAAAAQLVAEYEAACGDDAGPLQHG